MKKKSNKNIFSLYISPPIPKTQQLVSELLVLRVCVRPRGKNSRGKPVRNLLGKIKKTSPMAGNFMVAPPVFSGENYQIWFVKIKFYLEASGLWDVVMSEIQPL